jgi:hypothetical protein
MAVEEVHRERRFLLNGQPSPIHDRRDQRQQRENAVGQQSQDASFIEHLEMNIVRIVPGGLRLPKQPVRRADAFIDREDADAASEQQLVGARYDAVPGP